MDKQIEKLDCLEKAKNSPTFCIYPFTHLATKTEGTFKLCCRSEPIADVNSVSARELWNSDEYKDIRKKMLNGERPSQCRDCWNLESMGTRSMRQRALREFPGSRWSSFSHLLKDVKDDGEVPFLPKSIELKLSNLCNLRCRMCHAVDSSSWVKDWPLVSDLMQRYNQWAYDSAEKQNVLKKPIISGFEDNETWWNDFEKIAESVELIEFAGGEPLMDPLHYRILESLAPRANQIKLKYSTNMTHFSFKGRHIFDYWKNFKSVSVYCSIDGVHDVYNYIRTGTTFSKIEENLRQLETDHDVSFDEIAIACTIQIYNVFQLPEIMEYFCDRGIKFHSHRVTAPTFLNTQVMPPHLKKAAEEDILSYKEKILREEKYSKQVLKNLCRHIDDHVNHMNGKDLSDLIPAFVEYTDRLDERRGTKLLETVPQLSSMYS